VLKLAKTEVSEHIRGRIASMQRETLALRTLTDAEVRAVYTDLELVRDILSLLLDKADGKFI
jgi:hypothetical protein